jgi:hypothetical protein
MFMNSPFGATPPIAITTTSTADDEFENQLLHSVELRYPGMEVDKNHAYPTAGTYVRPDIVVRAPGTMRVLLVADAKRCARVTTDDVDQVAHYRNVLTAEHAAIFCTLKTKASTRVATIARRRNVEILPIGIA